jgi:hypothetical protein
MYPRIGGRAHVEPPPAPCCTRAMESSESAAHGVDLERDDRFVGPWTASPRFWGDRAGLTLVAVRVVVVAGFEGGAATWRQVGAERNVVSPERQRANRRSFHLSTIAETELR